MHRSEDLKDPIEVYFDNQIGIIEVETYDTEPKEKTPPKVAEGGRSHGSEQLDILAIIAARNEQEAKTGALIQEFKAKNFTFLRLYAQLDRWQAADRKDKVARLGNRNI